MKILKIFPLLLALCALALPSRAQLMYKPEKGTFALMHATIHTITQGTIEDGTVVIQDGKIQAVGKAVNIPAGAESIDCSGKEIYPGLIDAGTHLGLGEVESVSLTQDYNEIGDLVPEMQALTVIDGQRGGGNRHGTAPPIEIIRDLQNRVCRSRENARS